MAGSDKTVFDSGAAVREDVFTVYEGDTTIKESAATVPDGGTTLLDAALSDAATRADDASVENIAIRKGESILDTYTVESEAIEGGMGSVWRVHHKGWNVDLAMKRPQPQCFSTEKSKADFIHECEAWINLGLHPNIVSCYYVREISGTPTIFSEWMDGGSLESAIHKGTLYEGTEAEQKERIFDIAIQFARGLYYAHEAGLIHQDVKPDNLLLTKEGEAKVADFGLAKARAVLTQLEGAPTMNESAGQSPDMDGSKTIVSPSGGYTPAYCSMEQMDGKELTRRTDIYSWAVSVMEMYCGSRLWTNGVVAGLHCHGYFEQTRIPMQEALKELLEKCLAAEPEDRPHDFAEIEAKLHAIYQAETGNAYPRPKPKAAADTADSLNNRALSYLDLGKPMEAERCWDRAQHIKGDNDAVNINRTLFSWRVGIIDDVQLKNSLSRVLTDETFSDALAHECGDVIKASAYMLNGAGMDSAVVSADGRAAVVVPWDMPPQVFDLSSLENRFALDVAGMTAFCVAFSQDGTRIYTDCEKPQNPERCFFVFDAATGKCLHQLPHTDSGETDYACMRAKPDGSSIVCRKLSTKNGFITRDTNTGEIVSESHVHDWGDRLEISGFILMPCGTQAIVRSYSDALRVDLHSGKILTIYKGEDGEDSEEKVRAGAENNPGGHRDYISTLAIDTHGDLLVTGGWDGRICLWDVMSGKCLKTLHENNDWISSLCFCANGRRIVSGDKSGVVRFHDFPDGGHIVSHSTRGIEDSLWINDLLPTADPDTVVLIDNGANLVQVRVPVIGEATPMRLSHIANFKQTATDESVYHAAITMAEKALGELRIDAALAAIEDAYRCSFRDIEELAALNRSVGRFCRRERPRSARLAKRLELSSWNDPNVFDTHINVATIEDITHAYATGAYSNSGVFEIDLETLKAQEFCNENSCDKAEGLCVSPNGHYMTVVSRGAVELYDLAAPDEETAFCGRISSAAIEVAAACCDDDGNAIFCTKEGPAYFARGSMYREGMRLEWPQDERKAKQALFSPDRQTAYLMSERCVLQYRIGDSRPPRELSRSVQNRCMALSYDGSLIAVGGGNYDTVDGDERYGEAYVLRTDDAGMVFNCHMDDAVVYSLAFGPDGQTLYCALSNGSVNIYTLSRDEPMLQLSRDQHNNDAWSVAVTTDARYVLVGEQVGNLCIWELDWAYSFPGFTDWDEAAQPCLDRFHQRYPYWTESDIESLLTELQNRGLGYISASGVRDKLVERQAPKKCKPEEPQQKKNERVGLFGLFGKKK